ncbi:uncharacterized protein A4U43_UnF2140 [Asparagus officinalis]|uniref:Uncharacterized protein n=1 Tax=Asparagus officinalis TaxID=4686 RepID=A0A1R3L7C6_ASPOF|nr:uncharacterized protein LOC109827248 [Asparagus officinalis]ONK55512.1 uncharacterized protein A4U43_UnF2140 [Asparagus officinalis]
MAKRFLKQNPCTERDDAGCLSGFTGIFDFRVGHYSHKLLSNRKHSKVLATEHSRKKLDFPRNSAVKLEEVDANLHKDVNIKTKKDTSGMISVKTLMEEEMSRTHTTKIHNSKLERSQSDENNKKKSKKKCNELPHHHISNLMKDLQ